MSPTKKPPAKKASVTAPPILESVAVVFQMLDKLVQARRPMGVTEIAAELNEPKPRVYRHLASMRHFGIVEQDQRTDRYRLGARLVAYGQAASEQFDLRAIADPYLTKLRDATGHSAMVSVPTNGSALVVGSADSNKGVCISVKPGHRVMAHCSAQGRVVLAFSDAAVQERILSAPMHRFTSESICTPVALKERLALVKARLWDVAADEIAMDISALAAPIFRDDDTIAGTIGIVGTSTTIPANPPAELIDHVQTMAAAVSECLKSRVYADLGFKSVMLK